MFFLGGTGADPLLFHQDFECGGVNRQSAFTGHEFGQIEGKSLFIVELESKGAGNLPALANTRRLRLEKCETLVKGPIERFLLGLEHPGDVSLFGRQLGKHPTHGTGQYSHELVKERLVKPERASVAHRAAQDAAQDVVAVAVAGIDPIGHGEGKGPRMVGNDPESDVDFFLLRMTGGAGLRQGGGVAFAAQFFDLSEKRKENVGFVIRDARAGKIGQSLGALDHRADPLKAHAGIHMARGQWDESAVGIGIELNEDQVPDFNALGGTFVDQRPTGVALRGEVDMKLRARTARTGLAHHPEVVFLVPGNNVDLGVEASGAEMYRPVIPSFLIKLARITRGRRIDGGIKARRGKFPPINEKLPGPIDGLFFEIIAEAPVAEHLEKSVVVGVEPDVFEVVVFPTGPDALLGIGRAGVSPGDRTGPMRYFRFGFAQKDGDKLIHPRVGEKQVRRIRHEARRGNDRVTLLPEKIEEALADFVAGRDSGAHGGKEPPNLTRCRIRTSALKGVGVSGLVW